MKVVKSILAHALLFYFIFHTCANRFLGEVLALYSCVGLALFPLKFLQHSY